MSAAATRIPPVPPPGMAAPEDNVTSANPVLTISATPASLAPTTSASVEAALISSNALLAPEEDDDDDGPKSGSEFVKAMSTTAANAATGDDSAPAETRESYPLNTARTDVPGGQEELDEGAMGDHARRVVMVQYAETDPEGGGYHQQEEDGGQGGPKSFFYSSRHDKLCEYAIFLLVIINIPFAVVLMKLQSRRCRKQRSRRGARAVLVTSYVVAILGFLIPVCLLIAIPVLYPRWSTRSPGVVAQPTTSTLPPFIPPAEY